MADRIVTLLTDFGLRDWFVGVVHGIILGRAPGARVVDLTHDIVPGNVGLAAFVLEVAAAEFPPDTIHVAVVDPGVGTARRALCVEAYGQIFLGPDNGILEHALNAQGAKLHEVSDPKYFRLPLSRTFHARDIFAPAAAHLCMGVAARELGPAVTDAVRLLRAPAHVADGALHGVVAWIDRFGNCITDVAQEDLDRAFPDVPRQDLVVEIAGMRAQGLSTAYADVPIGTLLAVMGSCGRLELAHYGAHAASRLGVAVGDPMRVRVRTRDAGAGAPTLVWR